MFTPAYGNGTTAAAVSPIIANYPRRVWIKFLGSTGGNYYSGFGIVSHGTGLETASQGPRGIYSNAQVTFFFIVKNASSNVVLSASTIQNSGHVFGGFTYRAHE